MASQGAGALSHVRGAGLSAVLVVPAYIVAIAAAEAAGALLSAAGGAIGHAILIVVLLSHYALTEQAAYRRVLPALALAPLLRILSLNLAYVGLPQIYWHMLIGTPLLLAIALTVRLLDLSPTRLGLRLRMWPLQLLIGLSGLPLGVAAVLLVAPMPLAGDLGWGKIAIGAAIILVFGGFAEELLFRGLIQAVAGEALSRAGMLCSTALFAVLYFGAPSWSYFLFIGLAGLYFGWCVGRTGSIWGVALAHGLLNIALLLARPGAWW
jgi:uncharacterized protein